MFKLKPTLCFYFNQQKNQKMKPILLSTLIAVTALTAIITLQSFTMSKKSVSEPRFTNTIPTKNKSGIVPNTKTYVLQAPQPGETMPRKECKAVGKECKNNTSAAVTQFEWDNYFYGFKAEDFDDIEILAYPDYILYLQGIGFGM